MAAASIAFWVTFALLNSVTMEDDFVDKDLYNTTFNCKVDIDDDHWVLQCESANFRHGSEFLWTKFEGLLDFRKSVSFRVLLDSVHESEIYMCSVFYRPVIYIYRSSLAEQCVNVTNYAPQVLKALNESHITKLQITRVSKLELLQNIFEIANHLKELIIYNSSLPLFTGLPVRSSGSIEILILKQNSIEYIESNPFRQYTSLKNLDLSENYLTFVNKTPFDGPGSILSLDLSFNVISVFEKDALSSMPILEKLFLQYNSLTEIDENVFQNSKALQVISISNNDLKMLPTKIFNNLSELTNVSLSNCNLQSLDEDLFKHSLKLLLIDASGNSIQFIPENIFKNLKYLRDLNLSFNNIKNITREMFPHHLYLLRVNLSQNDIRSLKDGTFDGAPHIAVLDLSKNKIKTLSDGHVIKFFDLEYFDLRYNQIKTVELGMISNVLIRRLFLSHNLISHLNIKWKRMIYLESMEVDDNRLTSFELPPCIPSVKQTITFTFKSNNISRLNLNSLLLDEEKVKNDRSMMMGCFFNGLAKNFVDISNNTLMCDCSLYPFYKYIQNTLPRNFHLDSFLNAGNLTCASPNHLKNERIINLKDDVLTCRFTQNCPEPCICGIRGRDNMTFVNCSANGLKALPKKIPEDTTVLYFNKNKLESVETLNEMQWADLVELHLEGNFLRNLSGWLYPPNLRYLSLRSNKLKTLPSSLLDFIKNQSNFQLYLGDNDRNCACDSQALKNFLLKGRKFIVDADDVLCKVTNNGTTAFLPLASVPDSELCSPEELTYSKKTIIIALCSLFTFLLVALMFYYKQRQLILSYLYIHADILFRLCCSEEEKDDDKLFDAFVAYSSSDRDIVMDLLQKLESHPPHFRLCIHERNWVPGRFICDNILSSVQSSKRTIVILSNSFITSPWFNLELRAAVSKMSKDKISRIIVVLAEKDVSLSSVDPELRHVISKRTYLVWNERWFWEKLRYAMPRKKAASEKLDSAVPRTKRSNSEMLLMADSV